MDVDRCKEMSFDQLCTFISDALASLRGGSDPDLDSEFPRTKEEVLTLWEMLREKYGETMALEPQPQPNKLAAKRDRRRRLAEHVDKLRNAPPKRHWKRGQLIRDAEQKIEKLDREIAEMEEDSADHSTPTHIPGSVQGDPRYRALWQIRAAIADAFESIDGVPTTRLAWRLAESDEGSGMDFRRLRDDLQRKARLAGFDQDRVNKVESLGPKHRYEDIDGFDGYSVFTFAYTPKALMECFIRGNALFVIEPELGDRWQTMSKQELRTHQLVTWIPHRGNWFERVKQELGIQ